MKGKQARTARASRFWFRFAVLSRPPCVERAIPGSHGVPVVSVVASSPSSPASKQAARGNKTRTRREAAGSGGGMAVSTIASLDRIPAGNDNKQARRERLTASPHSYHLTAHGPHLMPNQSISPLTRQAHTRRRNETTGTTGGRRSEQQTDGRDENARASQDDKQATRRTTRRQTRRGARRRRQGKKASSSGEGMRTRRTKRPHFLTSRPTPSRLFSLICRPQLFPRPRAWDERR